MELKVPKFISPFNTEGPLTPLMLNIPTCTTVWTKGYTNALTRKLKVLNKQKHPEIDTTQLNILMYYRDFMCVFLHM